MSNHYTLITGRTAAQGSSLHQGRESDAYQQATALVEMSSDDMAQLGVEPEQIVSVSTNWGQVNVPVKTGDLPAGMIFIPMGPSANLLIGAETGTTGMPSFKGLIAQVKA